MSIVNVLAGKIFAVTDEYPATPRLATPAVITG